MIYKKIYDKNCTLIFKLGEKEESNSRYYHAVNLSCPQVFIFISENWSIFGSFCPNYKSSGGWKADPNAFLFSLNLNKKYPAKIAKKNYLCSIDMYGSLDFTDLKFSFHNRFGTFDKTGTYLGNYELDGDNKYFYAKYFLVYKVEYINNYDNCYQTKFN